MSARFGDLAFDDGFLTASRTDGSVVRFTRRERALLAVLAAAPGRLFDRQTLFEALEARGSDRNVDFVINRLRAKLGDTGAERRFISTQYGEGYVWVARPIEAGAPPLIAVRLVHGDDRAAALVEALRAALGARLGVEPAGVAEANDARFHVEASLLREGAELHAAFVLRHGPSGQVVATLRERFADEPVPPALTRAAAALCEAAWKHVALPPAEVGPTDPPLHLRLHAAAMLMGQGGSTWAANEAQIVALRARAPDDPELAMVWAIHRLARRTAALDPIDEASEEAFADEIEALVMPALPHVRDDPVMALAAAKLLLSIHRGHHDLAEALARSAFRESAAFAAAFPMLGQLRACAGDFDEAIRLFDEGLALSEPGSTFEVYIQVLKASTLVAADDRPALEAVYDRLEAIAPASLPVYAHVFLPPGDDGLARRIAGLVDRMSEDQARRAIAYLYHRGARYFRQPAHAANAMRGPLTHLIRRFGPGVVPDVIWRELSDEVGYLRNAARPAAE